MKSSWGTTTSAETENAEINVHVSLSKQNDRSLESDAEYMQHLKTVVAALDSVVLDLGERMAHIRAEGSRNEVVHVSTIKKRIVVIGNVWSQAWGWMRPEMKQKINAILQNKELSVRLFPWVERMNIY